MSGTINTGLPQSRKLTTQQISHSKREAPVSHNNRSDILIHIHWNTQMLFNIKHDKSDLVAPPAPKMLPTKKMSIRCVEYLSSQCLNFISD